jgi:hypothetical protein
VLQVFWLISFGNSHRRIQVFLMPLCCAFAWLFARLTNAAGWVCLLRFCFRLERTFSVIMWVSFSLCVLHFRLGPDCGVQLWTGGWEDGAVGVPDKWRRSKWSSRHYRSRSGKILCGWLVARADGCASCWGLVVRDVLDFRLHNVETHSVQGYMNT